MSASDVSRPRLQRFRRLAGRAMNWARYESERYVWHECELANIRPLTSRFVEGLTLRTATRDDLAAVERLGVPDVHRFDEFTQRGNGELWLGEVPEGLAIAFWVFHTGMPLYPWLELPDDTVAFEHTTVSSEIRGLGYATTALTTKLVELGEDRRNRVAVTKIIDSNGPSLKTAKRIGWRPTSLMYQRTVAGRTRTVVDAWTPFSRHVAEAVDAPGRPSERGTRNGADGGGR